MEQQMKCPCKDCICVPMCKHKNYFNLLGECEIISAYCFLFEQHSDINTTKEIFKVLNPTWWKYTPDKLIRGVG